MEWLVIIIALALNAGPSAPPEHVLRMLDTARSVAFESGDAELLDHVYPPGSDLLQADAELLGSYERRGIDIERLRMRIVEAEVTDSAAGRARLEITDRLIESRVRLADDTVRALPHDQPTRRLIELTLTPDGWRITAVSFLP